jgi:TusA-related sulfurtransferase/DNA-binding transcriptional ArsR family regulator
VSATSITPDRPLRRRGGVSVARALGSPTRAGIYEHLQQAAAALTVRDVAEVFELHPNVARTHLETLADAGLVAVGRRKHPGGGRPAKLYLARDESQIPLDEAEPAPAGATSNAPALLVRLLATLLDEPTRGTGPAQLARAHETAAAEGRRVVGGIGERDSAASLDVAAQTVGRALRPFAPEVRVLKAGEDWVDIAGVRGIFRLLSATRPELADVLERGLLSGAFAAVGTPVTLADGGTAPGGGLVWRARSVQAASARASLEPTSRVDARGLQREAGVVKAMRAITALRPGEVLEVLAEGPGSPAAFARWADRAGHELLGVERAVDATGRPGIRLLMRKGSS